MGFPLGGRIIAKKPFGKLFAKIDSRKALRWR